MTSGPCMSVARERRGEGMLAADWAGQKGRGKGERWISLFFIFSNMFSKAVTN